MSSKNKAMSYHDLIKIHDQSTRLCSFMHHMRRVSKTYEQIVAEGDVIVPAILAYLRDNNGGMNIMMLLWDILKTSPYEPEKVSTEKGEVLGMAAFDVARARQAWLDWGRERNLI